MFDDYTDADIDFDEATGGDTMIDTAETTSPEMAALGGEPTPITIDEALATGPVMAGDWWDAELVLATPEFLPVADGTPLLYPGKSHVFIGEPGRGKSMLGQYLLVQEAVAKRACLFIDLEKSFDAFRERIRALGATKEHAQHIGYWRLTRGITPRAMERIIAFCATWGVQCVVIDSVGRALSRAGLEENSNDHVRAWYDQVVEPLLRAGLTVVLIDHYRKPDGGGRGGSPSTASRYAKGAGAKMDVIDGAAYGVQTIAAFSRAKAGSAKVLVAKDNNGTRAEDETAAEMHVTPHDDGTITLELRKPVDSVGPDGEFRPTHLMGRLSDALVEAGAAVARTALLNSVEGRTEYLTKALNSLIADGFAKQEKVGRSEMVSLIKPYGEDDDGSAF